jgi:hypothetical protein
VERVGAFQEMESDTRAMQSIAWRKAGFLLRGHDVEIRLRFPLRGKVSPGTPKNSLSIHATQLRKFLFRGILLELFVKSRRSWVKPQWFHAATTL